jgi:hypothetical protein
MLFTVSQGWMLPFAFACRQFFPFHVGRSSFPFNGDFPSSCARFQIFSFWFADFVSFIFSYNLNITIKFINMQLFFTLDCFTLLVVIPKNKIRSIINSFIINTELPRLLIFLYCSPGTFSHMFVTLLLLLVCPGSNVRNELLSIVSHSGYPAFLSRKTGLRFFKRTIIIFGESHPAGSLFLPETVKPLALLYISLQTCVNNSGDNLS